MKYRVWIVGKKKTTKQNVTVAPYADPSKGNPSKIRVKDTACKSGLFEWTNYPKLRIEKI